MKLAKKEPRKGIFVFRQTYVATFKSFFVVTAIGLNIPTFYFFQVTIAQRILSIVSSH